VALGNRGGDDAITALEKALQDEEPLIQDAAAWALDRIKGG
jgi:HEAT repeat protein